MLKAAEKVKNMQIKTNNLRNSIIAICLVWSGFACAVSLSFSSSVSAAAGTQSSTTTTTAINNVKAATTLDQIKLAMQSFLNQYGMTLQTDCPNLAGIDGGGTLCTSLNSTHVQPTKNMAIEFIEEWSKYTTTWIEDTGVSKVYFVADFK